MKDTSTKTKSQATDWERNLGETHSDKGLVSKAQESASHATVRQQPDIKMATALNRRLAEEGVPVATKGRQRCYTLLVTRKLQTKTAVRHHHTLRRRTQI